jgi:CheY-like chemotaxis protein
VKILVAEDEENIAMGYEFALNSRGHQITLTRNGRECVERYLYESKRTNSDKTSAASPFDAVIMDYRMPEMDGIEAAEEILTARPNQRIIFASAYAKETLIDSIQKLHIIAELIQKPFDLRMLISTIENREVASQIQLINERIKIQKLKVRRDQISELTNALVRSKDVKVDLLKIFS